jgi:hypothetical protein
MSAASSLAPRSSPPPGYLCGSGLWKSMKSWKPDCQSRPDGVEEEGINMYNKLRSEAYTVINHRWSGNDRKVTNFKCVVKKYSSVSKLFINRRQV